RYLQISWPFTETREINPGRPIGGLPQKPETRIACDLLGRRLTRLRRVNECKRLLPPVEPLSPSVKPSTITNMRVFALWASLLPAACALAADCSTSKPFTVETSQRIAISKGRIALRPYHPSAGRVYQPAALPGGSERSGRAGGTSPGFASPSQAGRRDTSLRSARPRPLRGARNSQSAGHGRRLAGFQRLPAEPRRQSPRRSPSPLPEGVSARPGGRP